MIIRISGKCRDTVSISIRYCIIMTWQLYYKLSHLCSTKYSIAANSQMYNRM